MGGGDKVDQTKYDGIIVQSSLLGVSIPRGWGTNKLGCNLIDYLDFTAKKVSNSGGKGGSSTSTYDYTATLVLSICLGGGGIYGVRTIYKDSAIFTATSGGSKEVNGTTITYSSQTPLQAAGLSILQPGTVGQAAWGYLTTAHPGHDLGYSDLCYVAAENYNLNSSAQAPNHNFEVQFNIRSTVNGSVIDDALAADILPDFLADVPRWPTGALGDLTVCRTYTIAQGLWISPVATDGRQASDLLTEIMKASNCDCLWSDGKLQVVPYGDTAITANGVTFTPNLTPIYALTWDDIIPNSAGEDPIQWDLTRTQEAYNYIQLTFTDRSQQYGDNTAVAIDQANINTFGKRQANSVSLPSVCDAGVANTLAQIMVQRSANVRRTAEFRVSELFGLLDPMDIITVPLRNGGTRLVQIIEANESDDEIELKVEEMLVGTSHAAEYTRQSALGIPADFNVSPGDTFAPIILNPPQTLTNGNLEVWIAASGGVAWGGAYVWTSLDGDSFQLSGQVTQPSRYGVTTTDLPVTADPDTTTTLGVDLTVSDGTLVTATDSDADAGVTLCSCGTEIIAFSAATLTAASKYNLTGYIRRGLAGTTIADQPVGSEFLRLDGSYATIEYNNLTIGKTVLVKLQSYNIYGGAVQDLDLCETFEFVATKNGTNLAPVTWEEVTGIPANLAELTGSEAIINALVPIGINNLANSSFFQGATYWVTNPGTTGLPQFEGFNLVSGGTNYFAPNISIYFTTIQGTPAAGTFFQAVPDGNYSEVVCQAGDNIYMGAQVAYHRCQAAVGVDWYDATNTYLGGVSLASSGAYNAGGPGAYGGVNASNFADLWGYAVVPPDGTYATPVRRAKMWISGACPGGQVDPYLFIFEPMACKANPGQSVQIPYNPGPVNPLADQTSVNTALYLYGQATTATSSDFAVVTGATKPANNATVGATTGVNLNSPTLGSLTDSLLVTSQGTSRYVYGQGTGATANSLYQLSTTDYAALYAPGNNVVFNADFSMGLNGWSIAENIGSVTVSQDAQGSYLACSSGSSGSFVVQQELPAVPNGDVVSIQAQLNGTPGTGEAVFVDLGFVNLGNGALVSYSSSTSNPVAIGPGAGTGSWTLKSGPITAPSATDGSGAVVPYVRCVFTASAGGHIAYFRNIKMESGGSPTAFNLSANNKALTNINSAGRVMNGNGLPTAISTGYGAVFSPSSPLSSSSPSSISVAATTITLVGDVIISVPAGTFTGLTANSSYIVAYDIVDNVLGYNMGDDPTFMTDPSKFIVLGFQTTQNTSGGYTAPTYLGGGGGRNTGGIQP